MTTKTALAALEGDLIDALNAVQRARRHLEEATVDTRQPQPAPSAVTRRTGMVAAPSGVRYKLKPDAFAIVKAALAEKQAG